MTTFRPSNNHLKQEFDENECSDEDEDENKPLILHKGFFPSKEAETHHKSTLTNKLSKEDDYNKILEESEEGHHQEGRRKALWLSFALCVLLLNFWMLDSLKDPVLEVLSRNLKTCQPQAKMASVFFTLTLVCLMEYVGHERRRRSRERALISGDEAALSTKISTSLFYFVGIPYALTFIVIWIALGRHPVLSSNLMNSHRESDIDDDSGWKFLGYLQYVAIESYGSIGVAAFWSFTNSRLDLISAEKHYGLIIAVAQIGAIAGATISMSFGKISGSIPKLFGASAALVVLTMLIMALYDFFFKSPDEHDMYAMAYRKQLNQHVPSRTSLPKPLIRPQTQAYSKSAAKSFASGVYLILKHQYLIYILGVSCLYEVALTCLDYEMKLVGLAMFQSNDVLASAAEAAGGAVAISSDARIQGAFASFMGKFGQVTNMLSLVLSYYGFPFLMRRIGLRQTLPIFPSVLLCATVLIFAMAPNLWLIFICLALLKAMTYSINEPAKEILYIPTSNTIKLKAKFWIDVVGSRCAKALGSSITNYAGSADRIVTFGAVPSIITGLILLAVSKRAGDEFDYLVNHAEIIGLDEELMESNTFRNQYQEVYIQDDSDSEGEVFLPPDE